MFSRIHAAAFPEGYWTSRSTAGFAGATGCFSPFPTGLHREALAISPNAKTKEGKHAESALLLDHWLVTQP
jgi:hypothetical protein